MLWSFCGRVLRDHHMWERRKGRTLSLKIPFLQPLPLCIIALGSSLSLFSSLLFLLPLQNLLRNKFSFLLIRKNLREEYLLRLLSQRGWKLLVVWITKTVVQKIEGNWPVHGNLFPSSSCACLPNSPTNMNNGIFRIMGRKKISCWGRKDVHLLCSPLPWKYSGHCVSHLSGTVWRFMDKVSFSCCGVCSVIAAGRWSWEVVQCCILGMAVKQANASLLTLPHLTHWQMATNQMTSLPRARFALLALLMPEARSPA